MAQGTEFWRSLWSFMESSAPYLLLGIVVSGFLHRFLSVQRIQKWLGGEGFGPVLKAALLGVPLPLCSCAVIPAAVTLKKSGASNGATSSFLISTPESGVDSITVTYALMGLPMAILRPLAAFLSAVVAGILQIFLNRQTPVFTPVKEKGHSCCHHHPASEEHAHGHSPDFHAHLNTELPTWKQSLRFAFVDLIEDMAGWFILGIFAAASIEVFVPSDFFLRFNGALGKLAIVAVSIPMYICASAATPVAASMMLKGLSPGSALLFMLCGPATNISNIVVLQKYIGKKGVALNILAVMLVAWVMALLCDAFLPASAFVQNLVGDAHADHHEGSWFATACAVVLSLLLMKGAWAQGMQKLKELKA